MLDSSSRAAGGGAEDEVSAGGSQPRDAAQIKAMLAASNPSLHGHLFGPQRKRVLALDGGGVLGVIEIAFLEKIERELREKYDNPKLVLSDYFDLIGGTSTGAIIATALSLGMTVSQIKDLYFDLASGIFRKLPFAFGVVRAKFDARALSNKLRGVLGERQLQSTDLLTGLAIVLKRIDTGSAWVLSNNPMAKYWNDPPIAPGKSAPRFIGNKRYKIRDILRATTAAPSYFNPKRLRITEKEDHGLFVDGGVSPHNNPSLQLMMMASMKGYGYNWPLTSDDLMMISIGTGYVRPRVDPKKRLHLMTGNMAIKTLNSVRWDAQLNTLKMMQWCSNPRLPWPINREVGTLEEDNLVHHLSPNRNLLHFQRYDVMLEEPDALAAETGITLTAADVNRLNNFVDPDVMPEVYEIAKRCADVQVKDVDFPDVFDEKRPVSAVPLGGFGTHSAAPDAPAAIVPSEPLSG